MTTLAERDTVDVKVIVYFCQDSHDPAAIRCAVLARTAMDEFLNKEGT